MSTLGKWLAKHATHCGTAKAERCDQIKVVLRGITTEWTSVGDRNSEQITLTGLPKLGTTNDLLVLQPGFFHEQYDEHGEELPGIWVKQGQEVWIPIDSILYVTPGGA